MTVYLVIVNNQVISQTSNETMAREMAHDLALNGAQASIAQKLAECQPYPQPQWTELSHA